MSRIDYHPAVYAATILAIIAILVLLCPPARSDLAMTAKYIRAVDGDTIVVDLGGNIPSIFGKNISVRVAHIDAPEMHSKNKCEKIAALKAKDVVDNALRTANKIALISPSRDKYFRILSEVTYDENSLSQLLLKKKLAVAYEGGTKTKVNWCDNK